MMAKRPFTLNNPRTAAPGNQSKNDTYCAYMFNYKADQLNVVAVESL